MNRPTTRADSGQRRWPRNQGRRTSRDIRRVGSHAGDGRGTSHETKTGEAMAIIEDMFEGNVGTGLAVGVGVAVIGPLLTPVLRAILRPAAKAVIKAGMVAYDAGREGVGRINEMSGDVVAEVRSELDESRTPKRTARSGSSATA
jgi:hypothetical protein